MGEGIVIYHNTKIEVNGNCTFSSRVSRGQRSDSSASLVLLR